MTTPESAPDPVAAERALWEQVIRDLRRENVLYIQSCYDTSSDRYEKAVEVLDEVLAVVELRRAVR